MTDLTPDDKQRFIVAFEQMPYAGIVGFEPVETVEDVLDNLARLAETLRHVAKVHTDDEADLLRYRRWFGTLVDLASEVRTVAKSGG